MIRHFAGIPARLVTHRLLVQILQDTPDTKATVMTLAKNVDDTKITFVFTEMLAPPRSYLRETCSFVSILIARSLHVAYRTWTIEGYALRFD